MKNFKITLANILREANKFLVDYGNMYSNRMYIGKPTDALTEKASGTDRDGGFLTGSPALS